MTKSRALVVLPCYNERENIERLVEQIFALDLPLDLLVIDDNSPDGTGTAADAMRAEYPRLFVLHRAGKLGLGTAYRAGFHHGLDHGYRHVITMDADFSHQPKYLADLVGLGHEVDMVIGSRYTTGGGAVGWPLKRKFISGTANALARTVLGVTSRDCTSGYRCYSHRALVAIDPDSVLSSGYSFLVEMLYRVERTGLVVRETPIIFVDRELGRSKIDRIEVYKTLYTLGRLRFPRLPWNAVANLGARAGERNTAVAFGLLVTGIWFVLRRKR
ncbi:MAG: polyprenol monophosphomannose synthase [Chloroflexota bacterium]|nr:polyprenol monophosphomannose synthase [Chloroflexota bacterium]